MSGEKRRDRLLQYLEEHDKPVSGTELAKEFGVSRQVIVHRSCKNYCNQPWISGSTD